METRDLVQTQLNRLNDDELRLVYQFIEQMKPPFTVEPSTAKPSSPGLLAKLREIKISGPVDFAENVDEYLNGAHHDSANLP